jgi:Flp pilus assembly pilin Flp
MGTESFQFERTAGRNSLNPVGYCLKRGETMDYFLRTLWSDEEGQDVAEYSVMLAVILIIVVSTVRLIGSNAGNVFSNVGSAIQ